MLEVKEAPKKADVAKVQGPAREPEVDRPGMMLPWTEPSFALVRRFAEDMDRLFEDFGIGRRMEAAFGRGRELFRRETGLIPAEWSPRIEVLHRDGRCIVRAELPGMTKDDVKVEISDGLLTIQGEKKHHKEEKREGYFYSERAHGSFYRAIPLPDGAEQAKATAEFHNGVLDISMPAPMKPEKKSRTLEVRETK